MKNEVEEVRDGEQLYAVLARHHPVIVLYEDEEPELTVPALRVSRDEATPLPADARIRAHCRYGFLVRPHFARAHEALALAPFSRLIRVLCTFAACPVLCAPPLRRGGEEEELSLSWPARVAPGLFVGDFLAARNPWLAALGIEAVVDASQLPQRQRRDGETMAELRVAVHDDEWADISSHFEEVSAFVALHAAGCLVVCAAGVSRSCALVAAHLMLREEASLREALGRVRAARPVARPNRGFLEQLLRLELRLRGRRSATLYELDRGELA